MLDAMLLTWTPPTQYESGVRITAPISYEVTVKPRSQNAYTLNVNNTLYEFKVPDKRRCYAFELRSVVEGKYSVPVTIPEYKLVNGVTTPCVIVK